MSELGYSTAYKLFHFWFYVIIPTSMTYDTSDVEYFGITTTGDKDWDLALASAPVMRAVTVAEMAHLVSQGCPISLNDPTDAAKIYKLIGDHLTEWRDALRDRYRPPEPPLEGLSEFNVLAGLLMPVARGHGLVEQFKRPEIYKSNRAFSDDIQTTFNLSKLQHSNQMFDEIIQLASAAKFNVRKYVASLPQPESKPKGSMFS